MQDAGKEIMVRNMDQPAYLYTIFDDAKTFTRSRCCIQTVVLRSMLDLAGALLDFPSECTRIINPQVIES